MTRKLPSRYRRLDGALADLPLDEPMLLTELDGFLTGVLVCPEVVPAAEWMQVVWGVDDGSGVAPFDDPLDVQWFADAVMARADEIERSLARGRLQPIFDIDERNGDVLWEMWIDGFAEAMALRPERWAEAAAGEAPDAGGPLARIATLIAVARNESELDSQQINALHEQAPAELIEAVRLFHAAHRGIGEAPSPVARPARVGRNDPCPCGSGSKSKRCCGREGQAAAA